MPTDSASEVESPRRTESRRRVRLTVATSADEEGLHLPRAEVMGQFIPTRGKGRGADATASVGVPRENIEPPNEREGANVGARTSNRRRR